MNITISPDALFDRYRDGHGCQLIDVRTPAEFEAVHVAFARNMPLDQLQPKQLLEAHAGDGEPIYVICQAGARSAKACEKLLSAGIASVFSVEGGTKACEQAGLPMVRGQKSMSLERQVRIAAGVLILTGMLLGWFVHPAFYALAGFVGAGLVFAGITDTCGMGMLLARMPWNRCGSSGGECN